MSIHQQTGWRIPECAACRVILAVDGDSLAFARSALALLWREFGF